MDVPLNLVIACAGLGMQGSVGAVALRHARELGRHHRVTLVSDSLPGELPEGVRGVRVRALKFGFLRRFAHVPNEIAFNRAVLASVRRLHQEAPVHALICHSHCLAALVGHPLRNDQKVPFIVVAHGDIFHRPSGTYDPWITRLYRWATPMAYREADAVVAVSNFIADCAVDKGASRDKVHVIPNGIDPSEIGLDSAKVPGVRANDGRLNFLYVGRLSQEKRVDLLLKACAVLKDEGDEFELTIVGDGPLRDQLNQLAVELDIRDHVQFIGGVPRSTLGALYVHADVFCLPSPFEAQGLVVLEALISGCPVVGANSGGIPTMVQHHHNGLLFQSNDLNDLSQCLRSLCRDRILLQSLRLNTRASVENQFSWEVTGQALSKLLLKFPH